MQIKVLALVRTCGECPNYGYYSGNQYRCELVGQPVQDKTVIATFCPLPDWPAKKLADMDQTIHTLRELHKYGLVHAVMSHIATKLKVDLHANLGITIALKGEGEKELYIRYDSITTIDDGLSTVYFYHNGKKYKLHADTTPPRLYEAVTSDEREMWHELEIA